MTYNRNLSILAEAVNASGVLVATAGLWENASVISANYTVTAGNNAVSAGPVTINSGVTVTIPATSVWVIV
jgi:hypothetical protein